MRFGFQDTLEPKIGHWQVEYVREGHNLNGQRKEKNITNYDMYPCSKEGIWSKANFRSVDLTCTNAFNNTIRGRYGDEYFWYVKVRLNKCDDDQNRNITCANDTEIWNYFKKNEIKIPYTDMYIDLSVKGD
jgi:hypothetical protein